ncbi:MAG: flagellar basal body P-ring formation protein FlgA [Alphaproteobacteria bacterium]|nr:MAG: flagellar basal body P-ring formation protein FlgA [Alphaproteobacteria bacterium]
MKIILTYLILLFSFAASAEVTNEVMAQDLCSVELYSKVYRLETNQALNVNDIIKTTNCDNTIAAKISQIISNSSGSVGSDFLKRELAKDFPKTDIDFSPRKLSLLELNLTLRDQLTSGSNLYFLDSKSLNGIKTMGLTEGEQVKAYCESCNSFGEKNVKIDITNPLSSTSRTLWFSTRIMAKIKVFKAKRNLSFQQKHLEGTDFYEDNIFTSTPDNVVTSIENIHFYKANRTILQGATLSNLDLQAVNLVNFGTPVNVILKNQNINLQRTAMPIKSALFGEIIELKNPNNNKIIAGKVVDYNKVVIEL